MLKIIACLITILIPAMSFSEEIILVCSGMEYIQTEGVGTGVATNDKGFDVITMNTDTKTLRIRMSDNQFHTMPYNDDVAILSGKFVLKDKGGTYEAFSINRFNGNYLKKIVSDNRSFFSFVGMCMRGNKMF